MDNVKDMIAKGRDGFIGERNGNRKLTKEEAEIIRAREILGERFTWLAVEYGVDKGTIYKIAKRQIWKEGC